MITKPFRKTAEDHFNNMTPQEQRRIKHKSYNYQTELRQPEIYARSKMTFAQAWADKFGRPPMPEHPDNPRPTNLTFDQMALHPYYLLIEDQNTITSMHNASKERRKEVNQSRAIHKPPIPFSIAKSLGVNDPDEGNEEAQQKFQIRRR